jgi:hypothetical protein
MSDTYKRSCEVASGDIHEAPRCIAAAAVAESGTCITPEGGRLHPAVIIAINVAIVAFVPLFYDVPFFRSTMSSANLRKSATREVAGRPPCLTSSAASFGDEGARTPDLPDANRTLYQLSYVPARGDFQLSG